MKKMTKKDAAEKIDELLSQIPVKYGLMLFEAVADGLYLDGLIRASEDIKVKLLESKNIFDLYFPEIKLDEDQSCVSYESLDEADYESIGINIGNTDIDDDFFALSSERQELYRKTQEVVLAINDCYPCDCENMPCEDRVAKLYNAIISFPAKLDELARKTEKYI